MHFFLENCLTHPAVCGTIFLLVSNKVSEVKYEDESNSTRSLS